MSLKFSLAGGSLEPGVQPRKNGLPLRMRRNLFSPNGGSITYAEVRSISFGYDRNRIWIANPKTDLLIPTMFNNGFQHFPKDNWFLVSCFLTRLLKVAFSVIDQIWIKDADICKDFSLKMSLLLETRLNVLAA